jgi:hypothetical protein
MIAKETLPKVLPLPITSTKIEDKNQACRITNSAVSAPTKTEMMKNRRVLRA